MEEEKEKSSGKKEYNNNPWLIYYIYERYTVSNIVHTIPQEEE